jgi:hypothetical protein
MTFGSSGSQFIGQNEQSTQFPVKVFFFTATPEDLLTAGYTHIKVEKLEGAS